MADIFISYAKADRELALKLSAFFEAEGWAVWWDKSLSAGDTYRDEIMKQLAEARAVITIWTEHSVRSDWVRAEAGRAKADGKLIPVKGPGVTYADIPLPFGEMHTENITDTNLIRAAVVAQLAKPAIARSALWLASRRARYQFLTWVGIIGGAITLFSNLHGLVTMADWARRLVLHWHEWTQAFWAFLFGWVGIRLPTVLAPLLSFLMFGLAITIGARSRATAKDQMEYAVDDRVARESNGSFLRRLYLRQTGRAWRTRVTSLLLMALGGIVFYYISIIVSYISSNLSMWLLFASVTATSIIMIKDKKNNSRIGTFVAKILTGLSVAVGLILLRSYVFQISKGLDELFDIVIIFVSLYSVILLDRRASPSATFITMLVPVFVIIFGIPFIQTMGTPDYSQTLTLFGVEIQYGGIAMMAGGILLLITVAAVPLVAPLRLVNRKLLNTLVGVCLLVGLSVLSNFTPQLREWIR